MSQFMSLAAAVEANVRDGDVVAMEGFTHLIPHAAGHEVIRQRRKRLTLIRMTPDLIYDQLIGMGCAEKAVFSWCGNPGVGSLHRMRDAIENGWPNPLAYEEHSHSAMANAYEAGAAGLPFAAFRGYIGADLPKVNPNIRSVTCPYTDETLATVPAWTVTAIVCVPGGAHPSYAQGYYKRDNAYYKKWDAISRDRDGFLAWMKDNVLAKGPEAFAAERKRLAGH